MPRGEHACTRTFFKRERQTDRDRNIERQSDRQRGKGDGEGATIRGGIGGAYGNADTDD